MTDENFDLSKFDTLEEDSERGADCEILHPVTEEKLDMVITLVGSESKTFKKASRAAQQKHVKKGKRRITIDEMEEDGIVILARCTMGWRGVVIEGKQIECNFENAKMLYTRFPFIKKQVDVFVGDLENFTKS